MGDDEQPPQKTLEGFATPGVEDHGTTIPAPKQRGMFDDPTIADNPHPSPPVVEESGELYLPPGTVPSRSMHDHTPLVEIEVMHQHGPAPRVDQPAQTLEVWTQNRVYTMDPSSICVKVADRQSGEADTKHPFLGFKLVGGQHRDGETFEISYPFPRPGTEAVFEHPRIDMGNFSRTSTVTRVVLRLHVVTVAPNVLVPTWAGITNHELELPSDKKKEEMTVDEFLARRRTWRWNRGASGGYDAVEATETSVVWYRWSHEADGGRREVGEQSVARFRISGAPEEMHVPDSVVRELRAWLDAS